MPVRKIVVAHPDDEVIFFGEHLRGSHVLCLTGGNDPVRSAEFKRVLKEAGATGEIFGFRDVHGGWTESEERIVGKTLEHLVDYKDKVLTHNEDGEYGHPQHKSLNKLLAHFRPCTPWLELTELPAEVVAEKMRLLAFYPSQKHIVDLPEIGDWITRCHVEL